MSWTHNRIPAVIMAIHDLAWVFPTSPGQPGEVSRRALDFIDLLSLGESSAMGSEP